MHVPTQNWVQRSDKRQADRSSQKSFQNPFNDQFLNILQLQVPPNWTKRRQSEDIVVEISVLFAVHVPMSEFFLASNHINGLYFT